MPFHSLPNEMLLRIAWFVPKCPTCHCRHNTSDLFALSRTNRHLHALLTPELAETSSAMHVLLWAIWHNCAATATKAIAHGADVNFHLTEDHHVGRHSALVQHGTPLDIAVRNRLRPVAPAARKLALDIVTMLLDAGGIPDTLTLVSIIDAEDLDLLRLCIPLIADLNKRTYPDGHTLLEVATTSGRDGAVAVLAAAGASMEGTGPPFPLRYFPIRPGVQVQVPMDGSTANIRVHIPGWDFSSEGSWDEWGPVCMLPGLRHGCWCPWCPRDVTGGYSMLRLTVVPDCHVQQRYVPGGSEEE